MGFITTCHHHHLGECVWYANPSTKSVMTAKCPGGVHPAKIRCVGRIWWKWSIRGWCFLCVNKHSRWWLLLMVSFRNVAKKLEFGSSISVLARCLWLLLGMHFPQWWFCPISGKHPTRIGASYVMWTNLGGCNDVFFCYSRWLGIFESVHHVLALLMEK